MPAYFDPKICEIEGYSAPISIGASFSAESSLSATIDAPQSSGLRSVSESIPYTSEILVSEPEITDGLFSGYHVWSDFENGDGYTQSYGVDNECSLVVNLIRIYFETSEFGLPIPSGWRGTRVFKLFKSSDNSTWTPVEDFTNPTIHNDDLRKFHISLHLTSPVAERYLKVVSTGLVEAEQYIDGTWYYESPMVAEFVTSSGEPSPENVVIFSGGITATSSISGVALIDPVYSFHDQSVTGTSIYVTTEAPYGAIALTDEADALSIEVGAEIALEDAEDAFSITAAFGSFGTIVLTDTEDIFTSIPGGQAELSDSLDSFSIIGTVEAIATAGLSDSLDTLAIEALPGGLAECSVVDAADLLAIIGTPETTGGVNLVDASDPLSIQGMGGIASTGISLQDALDRFDTTAAPEETGIITFLDSQDVFSIMGGKLTRFSTHIIQYQKTRY